MCSTDLLLSGTIKDVAIKILRPEIKKIFKFATFYGAVNGGNSVSDVDVYSVTNGLETSTIKTPFERISHSVFSVVKMIIIKRILTLIN